MDYLRPFRRTERPWEISNRLGRMRYLVNHLVWQDSICQLTTGEDWVISTSQEGHRLIALWPNKECVTRSMKVDESLDFKFCLLYTSPSPRDRTRSRMPSSA